MRILKLVCILFAVCIGTFAQNETKKEETKVINLEKSIKNFFKKLNNTQLNIEDGMYAKMNTTKGEILIQLEYKKTPLTVANFVALAEGKMNNDHKLEGEPYYDGLNFHRVIADFMIQGGCPEGRGIGDHRIQIFR